jgi:CBS domain-containing protein
LQEEERKGGRKGRLLGIITLSDILRYLMGPALDDAPIPSAGETPRMSAPASPAPPPLSSSSEPPSEGVDPIDDWERLERVDEKTPPIVPNANAPANTEAHLT